MHRIKGIVFGLLLILTPSYTFSSDLIHQNLRWNKLPNIPALAGQNNVLDVAGPFSGISNDALIVAGGANFQKPVWDTEKHYFDDLFVLELNTSYGSVEWIKGYKLDHPVAYGASVSTPFGVLCLGGRDVVKIFDQVFLLSWDKQQKKISQIYLLVRSMCFGRIDIEPF